MKIALGQLPARPCSSSFLVLIPNWRTSRASAAGAARIMGEVTARLASMESRERNFMSTVVDENADWGRLFGAKVLAGDGT